MTRPIDRLFRLATPRADQGAARRAAAHAAPGACADGAATAARSVTGACWPSPQHADRPRGGSLISGLRHVVAGAAAQAEARLNESTIRLAVTGLTRAGKTVFLTSLISNLLAMGAGRNTLPGLQAALEHRGSGRLRSVRVVPAGAATTPWFDHVAKLRDLAAESPYWPPRTEDVAQIALDLEIDRGAVWQRFRWRRIRLELLDYPGEWLLDLPMLKQPFTAWSRATLDLFSQPPRNAFGTPFLEFLRAVDPDAPADDALIRRGHELYRAALQACREKAGLRYLQPGRFVAPGARADAPYMWFFPLDQSRDPPLPGSNAALLRDRYDAYRTEVRTQFFDRHFTQFDRQIVLVDVLGALHAGRQAFEDTARAIGEIAGGLAYDNGSRMPFRPRRITRVAFAATKADHVPALRRENLVHLVRALAGGVGAGVPATTHAVASVLATNDGKITVAGRPVEVVLGLPLGETTQRPFYPGDVPSGLPPESFWSDRYFELPVFTPPRVDASGVAGIPHLGLDAVLTALLKDLLA